MASVAIRHQNAAIVAVYASYPMSVEIERKFLVRGDAWRALAPGVAYCQGYITATPGRTVRVRVAGEQGYLTIKGATTGIARLEFEYPIPVADALEMLHTLCEPPIIQKQRHRIPSADVVWEVDEFEGANQGLVIAEVELKDASQVFERPDWIGEEVSDDPRYFNANLAKHPFSQWKESI